MLRPYHLLVGRDEIVQRSRAMARQLAVLMPHVVENLVLEAERGVRWTSLRARAALGDRHCLGHVVFDAAVRARRNFPLKGQLEIGERISRHEVAADEGPAVGHARYVPRRDLFDGAVHYDPVGGGNGVVAHAAPTREGAAVEEQLPTGGALGGRE